MVGKTVTALTPIDSRGGKIFVEGEYWNAVSDTPIEKGKRRSSGDCSARINFKSKKQRRIKPCHYR
jgi:hypothetical protein